MKTETEIPVLKKSTLIDTKNDQHASPCCVPKSDASICCTPATTPRDHGGACCAQPEDGSACCNK